MDLTKRAAVLSCGRAAMPLRMTQVDRQTLFELLVEAMYYAKITVNPDVAAFAAHQVKCFNLMVEGEQE
jgi:hypothetical protein